MKKFSELVVGDSLFIYYSELSKQKVIDTFGSNFLERKILKIESFKQNIKIYTSFDIFLFRLSEIDFLIINEDGRGIIEAISTSMDKLLIELEEN